MAPGLALCEAIRHQGLGHGISRKLWKGGSQKGVGEVRPRLFMTATGGGGGGEGRHRKRSWLSWYPRT